MNERFTLDGLDGPATSRAADGMKRRDWTLAEIESMQRLALGTWQGIQLFEHRDRPHRREIVPHLSP